MFKRYGRYSKRGTLIVVAFAHSPSDIRDLTVHTDRRILLDQLG